MTTIKAPSEITINSVSEFQFQLSTPHKSSGSEIIDCSALEELDGCGIQLLMTFEKARSDRSEPLLKGINEDIQSTLQMLGLTFLYEEQV